VGLIIPDHAAIAGDAGLDASHMPASGSGPVLRNMNIDCHGPRERHALLSLPDPWTLQDDRSCSPAIPAS
jgi:hypothetical protein